MSTSDAKVDNPRESGGLGFFERYLTAWVAACIVLGVLIGIKFPGFPEALSKLEYAHVSIPVAVLIWFMIYPMMVQIDFGSIVRAGRNPRGLVITLVVNWLIKPFTMLGLAWLFLKVIFARWIPADLAGQYVAGAIFLGAAPCTAMVFVWSCPSSYVDLADRTDAKDSSGIDRDTVVPVGHGEIFGVHYVASIEYGDSRAWGHASVDVIPQPRSGNDTGISTQFTVSKCQL